MLEDTMLLGMALLQSLIYLMFNVCIEFAKIFKKKFNCDGDGHIKVIITIKTSDNIIV